MMLHLFIVRRRSDFVGYGEREAVLVTADDDDGARVVASANAGSEGAEVWFGAHVIHIGTATDDATPTVLMVSYVPE